MVETRSMHCPNCAAPLELPLGEVETVCEYCASQLRFVPDEEELAVVRTREEMKVRERVAVQKEILRKKMEQEEMARWRETAGKVAIAALPYVGDAAGKALFGAALRRGGGCVGCGCLVPVAIVAGILALLYALLT